MGEVGCLKDGNFQNLECVKLNGGTAAEELNITSDASGASNAGLITANNLVSGSALSITSTSAAKTTGALVNIEQTGTTTNQAAPTLVVSTSATNHANAGVASFNGDTLTAGKAVSISANLLVAGTALDVTSTSAAKTTGALVNIAQTGTTTNQEAPTLVVSTSATNHANAGVASFTGNTLETGNAVTISATSGSLAGSALKIIANETKNALNITGGITMASGASTTQGTDKSTGVTTNKQSGKIVMHNESLADGATETFTLTNSCISAGGVIIVNVAGGLATGGSYEVFAEVATGGGSAEIYVKNISGGALTESLVLHFIVLTATIT